MSLISYFPFRRDPFDRCNENIYSSDINGQETPDNRFGCALAGGTTYFTSKQATSLLNNPNEVSFSFWIYAPADLSGSRMFFGLNNMSSWPYRRFGIFQYPSPYDLHLSWQDDNGSTVVAGIAYGVFTAGAWTHCAIVYKSGEGVKIYINGTYNTTMSSGLEYDIGNNDFSDSYPAWQGSTLGYLADCRIYNHALSLKEIKELSHCLLVKLSGTSLDAYKSTNTDNYLTDLNIQDESGHEWTSAGRGEWYDGTDYAGQECLFLKGAAAINYIAYTNFPKLTKAVTYSCWVYPLETTGTTQFLVGQGRDVNHGCGTSLVLNQNLRPAIIVGNGTTQIWGGASDALPTETWSHLVGTYDGTYTRIYVNGVIAFQTVLVSGDVGFDDMDNNAMVVGKMGYSYTNTAAYFPFVGGLRDIRVYGTALDADAVEKLYKSFQAMDANGKLLVKDIYESGDASINAPNIAKNGLRSATEMTELLVLEDGSTWIQLQHHDMEDGTGKRFSSQTAVGTTMYYDSPKVWSCFPLINSSNINHGNGYEFLVIESTYTYTAPKRYRWKQSVNPYNATFNDTTYANITPIENIVSPYGGMYYTPTYGCAFCFNNSTNGNWFGCGNVTAYQGGGCPGRDNTTRYNIQDVYMRIYNPQQLRQFKNGLLSANEIKCII